MYTRRLDPLDALYEALRALKIRRVNQKKDPLHSTSADSTARPHRSPLMQLGNVTSLGLVFPVAMALGYLGGRALGGLVGLETIGAVIGGAFGVVAGFYNAFRVVAELNRELETTSDDGGEAGVERPPTKPLERS